jgi:hypothetical protein
MLKKGLYVLLRTSDEFRYGIKNKTTIEPHIAKIPAVLCGIHRRVKKKGRKYYSGTT